MYDTLTADLRQRWRRGERPRVDDYVARYPGLINDQRVLTDLICSEIILRESIGESPRLDEYVGRYPHCVADVQRQFDLIGRVIPGPRISPPGQPAVTASDLGTDTSALGKEGAAETAGNAGKTGATNSQTEAPADMQGFDTVRPSQSDPGRFETVAGGGEGSTLAAHEDELSAYPRIPGFEILSELGRGGMGVVYRARQVSANRIVALKVVRNEVLETLPESTRTSTLERFRQEAQAAARLQHDNLVSVYEVGEVPPTAGKSSSLRYYAMRFVDGRSLIDVVRQGPLENRRAARYMEPVARALHSAHEQGILHRDLKPHNIMIEAASDRPLVTDFGLAKIVEGGDELTYAGEVMGTPSYMSPEQARDAAHVTAAADLYSLGATLYHLLTARPPFQSATIADTIRQIIDQEPVPPRQLNPAIDRDLETICLKCLQKDLSRRYASCGDFADDLQRYLTGCPIMARPVGSAERLWRWCRRNPVPAALSCVSVTLAVATFVSIVVGYRNTRAALAVSESRLERALQVVDDMFTRVSEDELLNEPGMQPLRKELLEKALKHYHYFLSESGENPAIRAEVAAAHYRVGFIKQVVGEYDEALKELKLARTLQQTLLSEQPDHAGRIKALADTCTALATLLNLRLETEDSLRMFGESRSLREQLVALEPDNVEFRRLSANSLMNIGRARVQAENVARQGIEEMQTAQDLRRALLEKNPLLVKVRRDLAMGWFLLGTTAIDADNFDVAVTHLQAAVSEFEALHQRDPRSLNFKYYLGESNRVLGGVLGHLGRYNDSVKAYEAATVPIRSLVNGNPDVSQYREELLELTMNLATAHDQQQNDDLALKSWLDALEIVNEILEKNPSNNKLEIDQAVITSSVGDFYLRAGKFDSARKYLTEADRLFQKLKRSSVTAPFLEETINANQENLRILEEQSAEQAKLR